MFLLRKTLLPLLLTAALATPTLGAGPCDAPAELPAESFWQKASRIAGLTANPSTLKGGADRVGEGDLVLWSQSRGRSVRRRLTAAGGLRTPIFERDGKHVLALRGERLVRVPAAGGEVKEGIALPGVVKLVGSSRDDPGVVLAVVDEKVGKGTRRTAALVCLENGRRLLLDAPDVSVPKFRQLVGWSRAEGALRVEVREVGKWSNVVLWREGRKVAVSRCTKAHCGQPSISLDGTRVVYVRGGPSR